MDAISFVASPGITLILTTLGALALTALAIARDVDRVRVTDRVVSLDRSEVSQ